MRNRTDHLQTKQRRQRPPTKDRMMGIRGQRKGKLHVGRIVNEGVKIPSRTWQVGETHQVWWHQVSERMWVNGNSHPCQWGCKPVQPARPRLVSPSEVDAELAHALRAAPRAAPVRAPQKAYTSTCTARLLMVTENLKITKISIDNTMEKEIWCHHMIKFNNDETGPRGPHQHEWISATQCAQRKSCRTYTVWLRWYEVQK